MSDACSELAVLWSGVAASALGALTGLNYELEPGGAEPIPPGATWATWEQPVSVAPGARLWIAAPPEVWRQLGKTVLLAAGLDDAEDTELRSTYVEAVQQTLSALGGALGGRANREVVLGAGNLAPAPAELPWVSVLIRSDASSLGAFQFCVSDEFRDWWQDSSAQPAPSATDQPNVRNASLPGSPRSLRAGVPEGSKTMELLLEVELPVGVSFGRTQMRVKDAIKLTTGSIVELNRSVSAPVEVVVNNCVIARGEVVVVEGNYGVRIQEIISREERLRTLF